MIVEGVRNRKEPVIFLDAHVLAGPMNRLVRLKARKRLLMRLRTSSR